jgi:hypothetical protein
MDLSKLPKDCGFCGRAPRTSPGSHIGASFYGEGEPYTGAICGDCIRTYIIELAHRDRPQFEKLVEEARNWKPGDP